MPHTKTNRGFTLVELVIAIAIMAIIALVAFPSYQEYVKGMRRTDAQGALLSLANAMERHHTDNSTYEGAATGGGDLGAPAIFPAEAPLDSDTKFYDLSIIAASASTYTVQATPKNAQAGDGILQLNSTGVRGWDRDGGGTITAAEQTWED